MPGNVWAPGLTVTSHHCTFMSEGLWQILYAVTPLCDPWGDLIYPYIKCNPPHHNHVIPGMMPDINF